MKLEQGALDKWRSLPHGRAWSLAWPMIVSNISVPLMGLADTAMLGHLDDAFYLAAVAIGSNIIALFWDKCRNTACGVFAPQAWAVTLVVPMRKNENIQ